jgi:hypothetical protein
MPWQRGCSDKVSAFTFRRHSGHPSKVICRQIEITRKAQNCCLGRLRARSAVVEKRRLRVSA